MRKNIEPLSWQSDLAAFGKRNNMRPTRLEVLGPTGEVETDFWLEDGLLLAGIDLDPDGERGTCVEIMLQAPSASSKHHLTHTVTGVQRLVLETTDGHDGGLEIEDGEGKVTIMHFESERPAS
jgi:alpha-L-fucosidase